MLTSTIQERTIVGGFKVMADVNGQELYCTVKNPDYSLNLELCGWYRTNDFNEACRRVQNAIN